MECVKEDVGNCIEENKIVATGSNREEAEQELNDTLFVNDSVTGNASGSYTFSTWQAEEDLCHNSESLPSWAGNFGGIGRNGNRKGNMYECLTFLYPSEIK